MSKGDNGVGKKSLVFSDKGAEPFRDALGAFAGAAESTQMALISIDGSLPGYPIVFVNDAFLALTGFTRETIVGRPAAAILGIITDSSALSPIQNAMAAGRDGTWEMVCRRADKSEFPAAIFLIPLRDEQVVRQNLLAFIEIGRNTCRNFEQQQPFHALYENAPGFIAFTEGQGHIFSYANTSYKNFVGRKWLVGRTVVEALPEIVDQGIIAILDEVYRTGEPFVGSNMPLKMLDADTGTLEMRCIDVVYQPVRDAGGEISGLFCEGYDVTAKHEANEALAALQSQMIHVSRVNAMGTMATTLAHEINQPLSAIANYIAGVRAAGPALPDQDRYEMALVGIEEASRRAAGIVQHLRELTRLRKSAQETFDLKTAVAECVRLVRASTSPEIQFLDQVPSGMEMTADKVQIQQVIINLLLNACDAMQGADHREITILAKEDGDSLVVCVEDTGPGVTLEAAEAIFSWSDSSKVDGMGLGLSICRTILEAHNGRIWLENSSSDGSVFCFCVPLISTQKSSDNK